MHDGPIVTWRNGDPIAPVSKPDTDTVEDGSVALEQSLFLPVDVDALDASADVDVAMVVPFRVVPVNVGLANVLGAADQGADQGAADQGALADGETDSVGYKVIESNDDDDDLPVLQHNDSDDEDSDD